MEENHTINASIEQYLQECGSYFTDNQQYNEKNTELDFCSNRQIDDNQSYRELDFHLDGSSENNNIGKDFKFATESENLSKHIDMFYS